MWLSGSPERETAVTMKGFHVSAALAAEPPPICGPGAPRSALLRSVCCWAQRKLQDIDLQRLLGTAKARHCITMSLGRWFLSGVHLSTT